MEESPALVKIVARGNNSSDNPKWSRESTWSLELAIVFGIIILVFLGAFFGFDDVYLAVFIVITRLSGKTVAESLIHSHLFQVIVLSESPFRRWSEKLSRLFHAVGKHPIVVFFIGVLIGQAGCCVVDVVAQT